MSSISFPTGPGRPRSPSLPNGHHEDFFGSSYNASSSFQINPLSAHPPRTPRTSVTSSQAHTYTTEMYGAEETHEEKEVIVEEDIEDVIEDVHSEAKARVMNAEVWREILKTSTGRDKAFKLIQYSLRVYLLFHAAATKSSLLRKPVHLPWEREVVRRLESTISGLSLTRKCLILFNWLTPLTAILAAEKNTFSMTSLSKAKEPPKPLAHTFLHAPPPVLLDLFNGLSDDIYTFSRLGLIGKRTGERAAKISDWCWFVATIIALVELNFERSITKTNMKHVESKLYNESMSGATANSTAQVTKVVEKELEKLQKQDYWLQVQRTKLLMDLVFVSYDVFNLKPARDTVKAIAALASAFLSSAKLFNTHRNTLILKETQH
ncbi:hypothetical protein BD410DRAFT_892604 [Rickenella mellea]|uniref:Peroxisomal biogenesis factor 11 n=1 Tax=Rickenella mellea TaxID=50990 RepID=A0A4R5XE49_9AGAM|nr:hypothetical protein BD410DRAFT_892604 [Rickenella mellea]